MSSSMGWISLKVPSVLTHTFLPLGMGTSLSNKRCPTPTTMSSVGGMKVAIEFLVYYEESGGLPPHSTSSDNYGLFKYQLEPMLEPPSTRRKAASRKRPYPPSQYQPIGLKRCRVSVVSPRTILGYAPFPSVKLKALARA